MRYVRTGSCTRYSEIGDMIEQFLDNNSEHISPLLWEELETLAEEVDNVAMKLEEKIEDLEGE